MGAPNIFCLCNFLLFFWEKNWYYFCRGLVLLKRKWDQDANFEIVFILASSMKHFRSNESASKQRRNKVSPSPSGHCCNLNRETLLFRWMEFRLLVCFKPGYEKGNRFLVPEPFYHSATLPGCQNAKKRTKPRRAVSQSEAQGRWRHCLFSNRVKVNFSCYVPILVCWNVITVDVADLHDW